MRACDARSYVYPFCRCQRDEPAQQRHAQLTVEEFQYGGSADRKHYLSDDEVRRRIDRVINIFEVCDVNPFGPVALKAAYNDSEDWLDALNAYIWGNYQLLKDTLTQRLPKLKVTQLEGTYLAWVDISGLGMKSDAVTEKLLHEGHVFVSSGTLYGKEAGEGFIRINLACPKAVLAEGLNRIIKTLQ